MRSGSVVAAVIGLTFLALPGGAVLAADSTSAPATSPSSSGVPTTDEIKALVNHQQYREAVTAIIHVLALRDDAATSYNRHELLMLRTECHLHLKQTGPALQAADQAVKEADEQHSEDEIAEARPLAMLIHKSPNNLYTPRTGKDRKPINILDDRKGAYKALFADELAGFKRQGWEARTGVTLTPLLDAATQFANVRALEHAATGGTYQTDVIAKSLSEWAGRVIDDFLDQVAATIDHINVSRIERRHRGLIHVAPDDAQTLRDIIAACDKVMPAVTVLERAFDRRVPMRGGGSRAAFLSSRARIVLTD